MGRLDDMGTVDTDPREEPSEQETVALTKSQIERICDGHTVTQDGYAFCAGDPRYAEPLGVKTRCGRWERLSSGWIDDLTWGRNTIPRVILADEETEQADTDDETPVDTLTIDVDVDVEEAEAAIESLTETCERLTEQATAAAEAVGRLEDTVENLGQQTVYTTPWPEREGLSAEERGFDDRDYGTPAPSPDAVKARVVETPDQDPREQVDTDDGGNDGDDILPSGRWPDDTVIYPAEVVGEEFDPHGFVVMSDDDTHGMWTVADFASVDDPDRFEKDRGYWIDRWEIADDVLDARLRETPPRGDGSEAAVSNAGSLRTSEGDDGE